MPSIIVEAKALDRAQIIESICQRSHKIYAKTYFSGEFDWVREARLRRQMHSAQRRLNLRYLAYQNAALGL